MENTFGINIIPDNDLDRVNALTRYLAKKLDIKFYSAVGNKFENRPGLFRDIRGSYDL